MNMTVLGELVRKTKPFSSITPNFVSADSRIVLGVDVRISELSILKEPT
jgi:hypothetical protein